MLLNYPLFIYNNNNDFDYNDFDYNDFDYNDFK